MNAIDRVEGGNRMRKIKFRAWDGFKIIYDFWIDSKTGIPHQQWYEDMDRISGAKIMQYTGLKDKNGKEIYEGDICKLVTYCGENRFFEVKFGSVQREAKSLFDDKCTPVTITGFYFELDGMYQLYPSFYANKPDNERMEVIGNIYENPELLEANNG